MKRLQRLHMKRLHMKKALLSITVFAAALLVACSGGDKVPGKLPKEGLAPFENSKHLEYLRDTLRVPSDVPVISFNAPKEAKHLKVSLKSLNENGEWDSQDVGELERRAASKLAGNMAVHVREDDSIAFHIDMGEGVYVLESESLDMPPPVQSIKKLIDEHQPIELGKEAPVLLLAYNDEEGIRNYAVQDFYEPEKFEGMDAVQIVMLEFTE